VRRRRAHRPLGTRHWLATARHREREDGQTYALLRSRLKS
jgi:hypothetical protein